MMSIKLSSPILRIVNQSSEAIVPFDLQWERLGVYRRYWGDVSIAERMASFDQIGGDPRFDHLRYVITDYLAVDSYEMTPGATEEKAAHYIGAMITNPRIALAAVVTDERIAADIRHFIAQGFISQPFGIFSTLEGARRWVEAVQIQRSGGSSKMGSSAPA